MLKFKNKFWGLLLPAFLLAGCTPAKPEEEVQAPVPQIVLTPEYTEMQAPARVLIEYEILPAEADVTITGIQNSGVYIRSKDDRLLFQTDNPGTYVVRLEGEYTDEEGETQSIISNKATVVVKEKPAEKEDQNSVDEEDSKDSDSTEETSDESQEAENSSTEENDTDNDSQSGSSENGGESNSSDSSSESEDEFDATEIPEDEDIYSQAVTIDQALANSDKILANQKDIIIEGFLPQDLVEVADGSNAAVIWNNGTTRYIILDNPDVLDIGGTRAQLIGTLSYDDESEEYHFYIKRFRQLDS